MTEKPGRHMTLLIRGLLVLLIAGIAGAAAVLIWMLITGDEDERLMLIIGSSMLGSAFSGSALGAVYAIRHRKLVRLMWCGTIASALAYAALLLCMFLPFGNRGVPWFLAFAATVLTVVAMGAAYTGVLHTLETDSGLLRIARAVLITLAWIWGGGIVILSVTVGWMEQQPEAVQVTIGLLIYLGGFIVVLGSLGLAGSIRTLEKRRKQTRESLPRSMRINMSCPYCHLEQEFPAGLARCHSCGFSMMIEIEEPRCECGYLLYRLAGDTCPECGRKIRVEDRWREAVDTADLPLADVDQKATD